MGDRLGKTHLPSAAARLTGMITMFFPSHTACEKVQISVAHGESDQRGLETHD